MAAGQARFRRAQRLRDRRDFRRLAAGEARAAGRHYVLLAAPRSGGGAARLGITASRRVGGAVQRNRVKRLIREWFRSEGTSLAVDLDLVVIARSGAVPLSASQAAEELTRLAGELES